MISFFQKRNPKRFFLKTALYLCGIMADAFGMAVFLLPMKFIVAGATGMGRVLAVWMSISPLPWSVFFCFCWPSSLWENVMQ